MQIYLGLGSNLGNKRSNITKALELINEEIGEVLVSSSFYESEPWGFSSSENFFNIVVKAETPLSPEELLRFCKNIEQKMGRTKTKVNEYEDRIIDIDILFYEKKVIKTEELTIPHPHIEKRDFVLIPMNEIAPEFIHPVLNKSISEIKKDFFNAKNSD